MPARALPWPVATSRAPIAILAALLASASAHADPPAGSDARGSLVGRWSGHGHVRGLKLEPGAAVIFDIRACGGRLCARPVRPDGSCMDTLIEIEAAGTAEPGPLSGDARAHRGRIVATGQPAIEVAVTYAAAAPDRAAQLHIRDAAVSLYSRRLPDAVSVTLRHQGVASCEARPTS